MIERVTQKLEADSQMASNVQILIIALSPSPSSPIPSKSSGRLPTHRRNGSKTSTIYTPSSASVPQSRPPSSAWQSSRTTARIAQTPTNSAVPPSQRRSKGSCSPTKKAERFHSVLVPSVSAFTEAQTIRNTQLNSISSTPPADALQHEIENEEVICGTNLPSLFLSIARSLKTCFVVSQEAVASRALRSLSLLSNFLGGLQELHIAGGGESADLFTLIEGLTCIASRSTGASIRDISITGPFSSLSARPSSPRTKEYGGGDLRHSAPAYLLSKSTSSTLSTRRHLGIQRLLLGCGIPLTAEELNFLVSYITGPCPTLECLQVSLKASPRNANLRFSTRSNESGSTPATSKTLSPRASLGRAFERIGPSLRQLFIREDWNDPLSNSYHRRVSFENNPGGYLLDEALALCSRLEKLGLPDGPLYSPQLLSVLPFTLKEIEIYDGPVGGAGGFGPEDVWSARSHALLLGLEKIVIKHEKATNRVGKIWGRGDGSGFEMLRKAGVMVEFG